jgi:hypothetical protein
MILPFCVIIYNALEVATMTGFIGACPDITKLIMKGQMQLKKSSIKRKPVGEDKFKCSWSGNTEFI